MKRLTYKIKATEKRIYREPESPGNNGLQDLEENRHRNEM